MCTSIGPEMFFILLGEFIQTLSDYMETVGRQPHYCHIFSVRLRSRILLGHSNTFKGFFSHQHINQTTVDLRLEGKNS